MSNRSVLRDIINLSGKLKPIPGIPFENKVYLAATEMLANEQPDTQRDKDGLTNHDRMLRNKQRKEIKYGGRS